MLASPIDRSEPCRVLEHIHLVIDSLERNPKDLSPNVVFTGLNLFLLSLQRLI